MRCREIAAFGLALALTTVAAPAAATIVNRVVAVVDHEVILQSDLEKRAEPYARRIAATASSVSERISLERRLHDELLDRMIEERLEQRAAERARLSVTTEEVERAIQEKAKAVGLSTPALFDEARRQGHSDTEYQDEIRRQLLTGKLVQLYVMPRLRVTAREQASPEALQEVVMREHRAWLEQLRRGVHIEKRY